jgi:hypothetical protein
MWKFLLIAIALLSSVPAWATSGTAALGETLCTTDLLAIGPVHNNLIEGTHTVSLTWTGSTGALWYRMYRGTASGGPYTLIADCISGTSYVDAVLASQTLYYVVTAVNAAGGSGNSNQDTSPIPLFDSLTGAEIDNVSVQINEALTTSDAIVPTSTQLAIAAETLTTSDTLVVQHAHSLSLTESLTTSDALVPTAGFQQILSETLSINDSFSNNYHKTVGLGEALTTSDSVNINFLGVIGLSEALTTSDAIAATQTTHSANLVESLATSDVFAPTGTFQYGLGEILNTVDAMTLTVTQPGTLANGTAIYFLGGYGIAPAGACAFTLQIVGHGFTSLSSVTFNGAMRAVTYVSPKLLLVSLLAADVAAAGNYPVIVKLNSYATVAAYFDVLPATPTIAAARIAGGALIVDGLNFVPSYGAAPGIVSAGTTVFWNGQALTTTWISSTRLQAQMPPGTFAIGTAAITVSDTGCFH